MKIHITLLIMYIIFIGLCFKPSKIDTWKFRAIAITLITLMYITILIFI
jgi:hypothetical protein